MTEKELHQAWLEIRDTMADKLLNMAQKEAFVKSILQGQLANPPIEDSRSIYCKCGHNKSAHEEFGSCIFEYNCDCKQFQSRIN